METSITVFQAVKNIIPGKEWRAYPIVNGNMSVFCDGSTEQEATERAQRIIDLDMAKAPKAEPARTRPQVEKKEVAAIEATPDGDKPAKRYSGNVYLHKSSGKWVGMIKMPDGKSKYVGGYDTEIAALNAFNAFGDNGFKKPE